MKLQSHQKGTVAYLEKKCTNQHGLLVFHNMGTGKTITAVSWLINRMAQYKDETSAQSQASKSIKTKTKRMSKQDNVDRVNNNNKTSRRDLRSRQAKSTVKQNGGIRKFKLSNMFRSKSKKTSITKSQSPSRTSSRSSSRASSRSSSRMSRRSSNGSTSIRDTPTDERKFDYLIICPENIKSSWVEDAVKLGFDIDKSKVISYEKVQGLVQANELDVDGKNVIFDEAHHVCKIMKYENMQYYTRVLRTLAKADKLLLMTGTPEHEGPADFMMLVNLVARRNKFPVHGKQLYEKYRIKDEFKKRKKSVFFNWVKPVAYFAFTQAYRWIETTLQKKLRAHTLVLFKKYDLSLHKRAKKYIKLSKQGQILDEEEEFGDDGFDMYGGGLFDYGLEDIKTKAMEEARKKKDELEQEARNKLQEAKDTHNMIKHTSAKDAVKNAFNTAVNDEMEQHQDVLKYGVYDVAKHADGYLKSKPTNMALNALNKYTMSIFSFLQVTHDPEEALRSAPMDWERMARDIGRYVSYYQQPSDSLDYGKTKMENAVEAIYSTYQSQQCLFFIYGTMTKRMVKFYANVDSDGAMLKIEEFRKLSGVRKYGRCISNMWEIVDCILDRQVKYTFNDTDGTVNLVPRSKVSTMKSHGGNKKVDVSTQEGVHNLVKKGCSKFKNLVKMLQAAAKKGERTLIRSDFKKQGVYLLSSYLNSIGMKHYYIRSTMTPEGRTEILREYNSVYRPVRVGDKYDGVLMEYVNDTFPMTANEQIYVGVIVKSSAEGTAWKSGRVVKIVKDTLTVLHNELKDEKIDVSISEVQRVFTVRFDKIIDKEGKAKQKTVTGDKIKLLPYDGPKTRKGEPLPPIMLLDKDSSEGISLMGVEHVHLLEPLLSVAERDQSLARAVRFQSHRHLPSNRHVVHVYTHIGVVKASKTSMEGTKAMLRSQLMFDAEKQAHVTKHFAGVVPRAARGTRAQDPIGYLFDKYWNAVPELHRGFDGTNDTPDTMAHRLISDHAKHIGAYTSKIRKTNVLYKDFEVPKKCVANESFDLKTEGF